MALLTRLKTRTELLTIDDNGGSQCRCRSTAGQRWGRNGPTQTTRSSPT